MRLAVAIALAVLYAGLTLAWGGVDPRRGGPWWVFAPFIVLCGAALLAEGLSHVLPGPWAGGRRYDLAPRRVRLSWKMALRLPASTPLVVFLYYVYWSLSLHFHIGWVAYVLAAASAIAVALLARKRRREIRLLRDGEVAAGVVDGRSDIGEGPDRIAYHYTTAAGETVSALGWDLGYGVAEGTRVPVFYDAGDPGDSVVACGCWFEAD
jgi:hypothetical protein